MKWISVEDERPRFKQDATYLVSDGKDISITFYAFAYSSPSSRDWIPLKGFKYIKNVTHWMPLPKPSKEN